ncbi:hypothetical protein GQ53DRAFT_869172 [Thozetella sp. PMI_491]|nr:hypothetical protein GQ53DRAFT_869172 [Thozetella sp. PMI_491]
MEGNRKKSRQPKKLVLCFDGTGNKFKGDDSDSNILKIFRMLDRTSNNQSGIGTYIVSTNLTHTSTAAKIRSWYMKAKDSAVGSSFDQHVVGGYRFLMRFYCPGDEIYVFGFSRGAYTARFLAEMLDYVGLLSHGNEEMISFAWKAFSQWQCRRSNTTPEGIKKKKEMYAFLKGFRETFSRPVRRIRFLGLFDTVNSVPRFETAWMERSKFPYTARTSAKVVRHAVSIDERRAKFRQDLIYQSGSKSKSKAKRDGEGHHHHHLLHHHHHHAKPEPGEKFRRRSSAATLTALKPTAEDRGRRQTVGTIDTDIIARFRSRSRGTRPSTKDHHSALPSDGASVASVVEPHTEDDEHNFESDDEAEPDIDEVWFSGGHGDVGGGWEIIPGSKSASHVPLAWMVREAIKAGLNFDWDMVREMGCVDALEGADMPPGKEPHPGDPALFPEPFIPDIQVRSPGGSTPTMINQANGSTKSSRRGAGDLGAQTDVQDYVGEQEKPLSFHAMMRKAHLARIHDSLAWDCGMSKRSILSWKLMEYLPFRRMDLQQDGSWKPIRWPLPCGEVRDIPDNVRVHGSVIRRMQEDETYRPGNLIIGGGGRGIRVAPKEHGIGEWVCVANEGDMVSEVWMKKGQEHAKR